LTGSSHEIVIICTIYSAVNVGGVSLHSKPFKLFRVNLRKTSSLILEASALASLGINSRIPANACANNGWYRGRDFG